MSGTTDICRLDYLVGTLATAYRGLIISLVMKDFCMTGTDGSTLVKGTILSMPQGDYEASLIHEGKELSRSGLNEGFFEIEAASGLIAQAKNLQVDIIQNGRHIGTFLLKKEKEGGEKEGVTNKEGGEKEGVTKKEEKTSDKKAD